MLEKLYHAYSPVAYSLADRGYLAHLHPLELWVVGYLRHHPGATMTEVIEASAAERQEVYSWLFRTHSKYAQDSRIRTMIEVEAFQEIHQSWKRLGYPFGSLVPSYASAIGSSGDRPTSLAELIGIIINNGVRYPTVRIEEMHFAEETPFETIVRPAGNGGERVLVPEIAAVVRSALIGVVEHGTAVRIRNAFRWPDGSPLVVGGKTGTGDNRFEVFGTAGRLINSRVVNRTAAFVFMIDDRFFGTITAYVEGREAEGRGFTSSLPLQVLKALAPKLMHLVEKPGTTAPGNLGLTRKMQ
jgi:membrane peptidoglycan carboxypeptidase